MKNKGYKRLTMCICCKIYCESSIREQVEEAAYMEVI